MDPNAQLFAVSPWEVGHPGVAEAVLVRMLQRADIDERSRVMDLGCGKGELSVLVAREFGCSVVGIDDDVPSLETLRQTTDNQELGSRVEARQVRFDQLPTEGPKFDAVMVCRHLLCEFSVAAATARAQLMNNGHLIIGYPVWVGRFVPSTTLELWQKRLGDPLRSPRELLEVLSGCGFEPEAIELVEDPPLEAQYAARESPDEGARPNPATLVRYALASARRKNPDEKPPASRHWR
jgi:SAM-dependent methyltransferase